MNVYQILRNKKTTHDTVIKMVETIYFYKPHKCFQPSQPFIMIDSKAYEIAKKRVAAKKGFFWHLGIFLVTMVVLMLINLFTYHGKIWFIFPFLGWGLSVAIHYLAVFGFPGIDEAWEEKAIQKELYKIQKQQQKIHQLSQSEPFLEDYEELDLQAPVKRREKRLDEFV